MTRCVYDYYGKCNHSGDRGEVTSLKCKTCPDYRNIKIVQNQALLRQYREGKARLSKQISEIVEDIAAEQKGR